MKSKNITLQRIQYTISLGFQERLRVQKIYIALKKETSRPLIKGFSHCIIKSLSRYIRHKYKSFIFPLLKPVRHFNSINVHLIQKYHQSLSITLVQRKDALENLHLLLSNMTHFAAYLVRCNCFE